MRHEERARANIVEVGQRLHARACVASNDGNINVLAHAAFADLGGAGMRAEGSRTRSPSLIALRRRRKRRIIIPTSSSTTNV